MNSFLMKQDFNTVRSTIYHAKDGLALAPHIKAQKAHRLVRFFMLAFEKGTALRNMLNVRQLKRIFNFTPQNAGRTSPFPSPANYPPNRANINVVHRLK